MTAPKIKMLAHNGGLPSGNYPVADLVRYIRADAPELVAMREEILCILDYVQDAANGALMYRGKSDVSEMAKGDLARINATLKAYDALK